MKHLFVLLVLLSVGVHAQTPIDQTATQLDSLRGITVQGWTYSTDFSVDPAKAGFDDAAWKPLAYDQRLMMIDSCWMRAEVTLPQSALGRTVAGRVRLLLTVDDFGFLYVDGANRGRFPWDGDFVLTEQATPGQHFSLAIRAHNTGGPMRLLRAQLVFDQSKELTELLSNVALSLRIGAKLTGFDTYQSNARVKVDPGIDRSRISRDEKLAMRAQLEKAAAAIDFAAMDARDLPRFQASVDAARALLTPVGAYAKRFSLFFIANAHIDAAWLWRKEETVEVCKNTFSSVFNMMRARPDFTYTQSSALYYKWMEQRFPAVFAGVQDAVKTGRWEITGGMWVEPDCNLPSGESWMRHLLYGKRYFREKFGVDVGIGWNPDSFGYNGNMPQFYKDAGIDAFITQKIGWNEVNVFPHRVFWWEAADGSRILSVFPFDYVNTVDNPFQLVDWLRQYEANTGFEKLIVLFGVGDHGGGPSLEMIDRIEKLKKLDVYPSIEYGTTKQYLDWVKKQDLSKIPVWTDELYLEYHQGTFTTQAKVKEGNRRHETLLGNAEKFASVASLFGAAYPSQDLRDAWEGVMLNQFHDILPGSSIREVYIDAAETYRDAALLAGHALDRSLDAIASRVNTSSVKNGRPLVVFNPLAWTRTDLVRVPLPAWDDAEYEIRNSDGADVPSQAVRIDRSRRELLFIARDVPSIGYATYALAPAIVGKSAVQTPAALFRNGTLESGAFRVRVDTASGWLSSIRDLRADREVLAGPGNELQLLEDVPKAWSAWNIGWTGVTYPLKYRGCEVVETGPVRTVLRLKHDFLRPGTTKEYPTEYFPSSFFDQDVILYNGIDRMDFHLAADWWEEKIMLKAAFPLAVKSEIVTFEIPFGSIRRAALPGTPLEKAKTEVPALRWADMSDARYGVSLLNSAKYGHDARAGVLRLSLLRAPVWPDPTADRGKHEIDYALYPHAGDWKSAGTVRRGYEFNTPLLPVFTTAHTGELPASQPFVTVSPDNIVLASVKKAEDGDALVLQLYDAHGVESEADIRFVKAPKSAVLSSVLEADGTPLARTGNSVRVRVPKHKVVTVKVTF
ncbi:MAG: alpha-mannosidase [Ignavibacteria bacterium]|nr:alpha-mannosidase [Ignavibacteria bacterium]